MVRLEAAIKGGQAQKRNHFNSTMVRLEVEDPGEANTRIFKFQFHDGTIRRSICAISRAQGSDFNSTMVRLEASDVNFFEVS